MGYYISLCVRPGIDNRSGRHEGVQGRVVRMPIVRYHDAVVSRQSKLLQSCVKAAFTFQRMHSSIGRQLALQLEQGPRHGAQPSLIVQGKYQRAGCDAHVDREQGSDSQAIMFRR